jgi:DNA-binding NarL/FixJ family response regulator
MTAAAYAPRRAQVLIAADRLPTRVGLRLALESEADCTEASDLDSAVETAVRDRPDVCVVDLMSSEQRIHAATEIAARVPSAAVIVLTALLDEAEFLAIVRAGAAGYLPETVDPARLPYVVRDVMRGEAAVPRKFVSRLIAELRGRERRRNVMLPEARRVVLTRREWQVVELLQQRLGTREIAERLGISQVTVRRHLGAVEQKLGVTNRRELLDLLS